MTHVFANAMATPKYLWEKALEDVWQVVERRPRLVDDVQAHGAGHLVNVGMVDLKLRKKHHNFYK